MNEMQNWIFNCMPSGNEKGKRVIDARIENLAHFPDVHNGMEPPSWDNLGVGGSRGAWLVTASSFDARTTTLEYRSSLECDRYVKCEEVFPLYLFHDRNKYGFLPPNNLGQLFLSIPSHHNS